jgi:lipopolysaccharide/colanic/teichoic acid biosynthesis glycosyltransferase
LIYPVAKRAFDLTLAGGGLVFFAPLLGLAALLIKLEDGGEVFFRQVRIGRDGESFRIWKLRTMVVGAENAGAQLTVAGDRRVTRVGRWLRRTRIDELPQLINVLVGEMSFVGPRPEVPKYVAQYSREQRRVLRFRPGITDPATIRFHAEGELLAATSDPDALYVSTIMPEKLRINLDYADRATLWLDLIVLWQTLAVLARRETNDDGTHARPPSSYGGTNALG